MSNEHAEGKCLQPHEWLEVTTFGDAAMLERAFLCRHCPAEKREPLPPGALDHRELLRKYMDHVHYYESTDFVDRISSEWNPSPVNFTAEEKVELARLAGEEKE